MRKIERRFRLAFSRWGIALPPEDARDRRRGKIVEAGWPVWYLFGEDERGEYLDYYASHRMTHDRHVRIYGDGTEELLPAVSIFRFRPADPVEDARLEAEYREYNRRVGQMLEEKGFGMVGDEPGSVRMNRHLSLGREEGEASR